MISYEDYGNMILISVRVNIQDIFFFYISSLLIYFFVLYYLMGMGDEKPKKEVVGEIIYAVGMVCL